MKSRRFLSLLVVLVLSLGAAACCSFCEPEVAPDDSTTIYMPHEHVAQWVVTNNNFDHEHTEEGEAEDTEADHDDTWTGILFQLGNHDGVGDGAYEVVITPRSGAEDKYLLATQKIWVNIVADETAEPMTRDDLTSLWPDPDTPGACGAVDGCADSTCLCRSASCEAGELEEIPADCLRNRTLHRGFNVLGVLTYWNGDEGFTLEAYRKDEHHLEHEFTLHDPVRVEVWELETGGDLIAEYDLDAIETISIQEAGTVTHGIHETPPWPGFGL